ncbi:alpha/beta fold hydrolase [Paractinoplanes durhamensis]|uniref:Alpha/beta hydrolase n=1 Tax=Paractinoplanes durhamensis TaxID=113563 RepID=A0ABQ3Z4N5_9ACTN|nr:alpha/beta hydrolase [Actinoplanes durhamensis]GIE04771.1 alpha/beta hydrolase [Actinoplanes durhamensis]
MAEVRANGVDIWYETVGDPGDPALLLVMGLGAQLIDWPAGFVEQLAGRGFYVVLFDNRDSGLSTGFDELGVPDVPGILAGDRSSVGYLISDLAGDAAGLLKELGISRAHVVGASMGGMIAQQLLLDHPELVVSLASIMSTTGARGVGRPKPEAAAVLMRPPSADRAEAVAGAVGAARVVGSPGYPAPQAELERRAGAKYDRGYRPAGTLRQYAAIVASPDRTPGLREVSAPVVVIHGADDPLIPLDGGEATASAVPGASLLVIPGMGHDLPVQLWGQIVDAIVSNAGRA